MTAIQFYHLTATPLDRALPKLMEKALAGGLRTLVVGAEPMIAHLDDVLWTYDAGSFLPHGTADKENASAHPVLLSVQEAPVNDATLLVVIDGRTPADTARWQRVLDVFDGPDDAAVAAARQRWAAYKAAGHELTYLKQTESGGWQQPA